MDITRPAITGDGYDSDDEGSVEYLGSAEHSPKTRRANTKLRIQTGSHDPSQHADHSHLGLPTICISHVPRDPTQPKSGSISDVHSDTSNDDEESDSFPGLCTPRPRSNTCPETTALIRKAKVRSRSRPSTPPPDAPGHFEIEIQMAKVALKERFNHQAADCIPESPKDKDALCDDEIVTTCTSK